MDRPRQRRGHRIRGDRGRGRPRIGVKGPDLAPSRKMREPLSSRRNKRYRRRDLRPPPDRINLVVGHLSMIRSGAAFLVAEKPGEKDVFVPANAHLRHKGRDPEPQEAFTLRHRQVREMYPVVGVIFDNTPQAAKHAPR